MPFDFKSYDEKCNGLTPEELQREWQHYTRLISGAATSTAVSGIAVPFTLGVSTIGVAMAAPAIHNARKKREIIEKHLNKHNATHTTRKRDVLGSVAFSGTIGVVTLGVGSMGADAVATSGAEHGISAIMENETAIKIVTHAALDGAGMAAEHAHTSRLKKKDAFKAFKAAGVFTAVKDAKAAEAGYSISPYNPQGVNGGSSSSNPLPPPSELLPPPPYNVAVGQTQFQPGYLPNQNAYTPDFKAPMSQSQVVQDPQLMTPAAYGQQPTTPQYYSQVPPPPATDPASTTTFPVGTVASSYQQTSSGGYPPCTGQTAQGYQPAVSQQQATPLYPQSTGSSTLPAYNPTAPSGVYDMKSMNEALPTQNSAMATSYQQPPQGTPVVHHGRSQSMSQQTPQAHPSTPVQPNHTGQTDQMPMGYPPPVQSTSQPQSVTSVLSTQSYVSGQSYVAEPSATQVQTPVQVPQGHAMQYTPEYQKPATQGLQQGYQNYSSYTSPQQTGAYQGTNQAPPPPPPANSTRRDSAINTLQHTFTPQQYAPAPQQEYTYSATPAQQPQQSQSLPPPPPPPGPPPSGPVSQPPAAFNATQTQQYSTGTYSALQSPVVQNQQQYQPIAPPQQYQQQYQQQPDYPPTPVSLPNQPPVSQHQQQYQPNAPPQQYQPQYQQQPQSYNYPPTPASLPNQTPMTHHHTGSSYFPPPPTTKQSQPVNAPQQGQQPWNGQMSGHMPYTPATSPGTMWQPQAISQIYPQHQQ
ncbi:hypothetical protein EDB80DRAFT_731205 [Ilyonectria destructans]|nr:hypothetical protein EDB80DRAFT_731205 [Ilyonectria destructans]